MSKKTNGVNHAMTVMHRARRIRALEALKVQLEKGLKPDKTSGEMVVLTDKDKKRINKEIETLKTRI